MAETKFKIGDTIRVIGYRPVNYPPGMKDELGTEELFQSMVGRSYKIEGFDEFGHIKLNPREGDTVWIEPDLVELAEDSSHAASGAPPNDSTAMPSDNSELSGGPPSVI